VPTQLARLRRRQNGLYNRNLSPEVREAAENLRDYLLDGLRQFPELPSELHPSPRPDPGVTRFPTIGSMDLPQGGALAFVDAVTCSGRGRSANLLYPIATELM
jgi:hypothetical protein